MHETYRHAKTWKQIHLPPRRTRRFGKIHLPPNFFKNFFLVLILLGLTGSLGVLGLFAFVSRDLPDPNTLTERQIRQTTKIYDRTGEHLLYEIFGEENRTLVKIQEGYCKDDAKFETNKETGIPLFAIQATMAAEDRKFCEHHGFDVKALARAVIFRGSRGGGSTLTQQLVKNAILSNEKTLTRKAKELILSTELERRYSKDAILQIYFNEIPYGSTYYGIQAASQNFFKKSVHELTLAQAATLAALPKSPTTYLNNPDRLQTRRDWILDGMFEMGFIAEEERDAAKAESSPVERSLGNITAPHFVLEVKEQLGQKYGERQVEEGGLRVTTTLDYDMQLIAEEEVVRGVEERGEKYDFENAALVATDPKNGQVLAMVGSKNFHDEDIDGQVNVATRLRQPGSSIKPIIYTLAFSNGYTPNTILWDVVTKFPTVTGEYEPHNYDLGERGQVSMRNALQLSLNIPAIKTVYLVGVENALDFATSLGYGSFEDHSKFGLSIVLGGGEVKLLEHVAAYGILAAEGVKHPISMILKVEDADGNTLEEWKEDRGDRVIEENVARMTTDVLSDNEARTPVFGANNALQLGERPIAAKTGTTNDYHDGWTLGYTPSLASGVWVGNSDNRALKRGADGSVIAAPIWNAFMRRALEGQLIETFTQPEIPHTGKPVLDGRVSGQSAIIDKISGKLATQYTPPSLKKEAVFAEYHSILHYLNRENPTGPTPTDPASDPYYAPWEEAIANWIHRQEEKTGVILTRTEPPTQYDDVHVPSNFPNVQIDMPVEQDAFSTNELFARVSAHAPRGIARVEFYLDGFFLGADAYEPFELTSQIPTNLSRGYHMLKAVAYDDVENSASDSVGIRLEREAVSGSLEILDPKNGQTIDAGTQTFSVVVSIKNPSGYSSVALFAQPVSSGARRLIERKTSIDSPFVTLAWPLPAEGGSWALSVAAQPADGSEPLTTAGTVVYIK